MEEVTFFSSKGKNDKDFSRGKVVFEILRNKETGLEKLKNLDERKGFNLIYGEINKLDFYYLNNRDIDSTEAIQLEPGFYSIANDVLHDEVYKFN
jgi:uncharacterized protein with NRDE domain